MKSIEFDVASSATASASRVPGLGQVAVLLMTAALAAMITAILGPSLPVMQAHFANVPRVEMLVPLIMSAPALSIALLSVVAGELADRWGRKRLLIVSAFAYAFVGTMPLYLESVTAILASRFALGVFEAALLTISTALIGDYYHGLQRVRYMALQTTATAVSVVVLSLIGGVLAAYGWRTPYAAFGIGLLLPPLMMVFLWEPVTRATMSVAQRAADDLAFRPGALAWRCVLAVAVGASYLVLAAHFAYLLNGIGIDSPPQIGLAFAIYGVGNIAGTLLFGWVIAPALSLPLRLASGALLVRGGAGRHAIGRELRIDGCRRVRVRARHGCPAAGDRQLEHGRTALVQAWAGNRRVQLLSLPGHVPESRAGRRRGEGDGRNSRVRGGDRGLCARRLRPGCHPDPRRAPTRLTPRCKS
ncbi:MAG: MFS transporter [Rubrivivax sp.]